MIIPTFKKYILIQIQSADIHYSFPTLHFHTDSKKALCCMHGISQWRCLPLPCALLAAVT